tara:strand:+ start:2859 stop:3872 length:1014 start_codon:yes stop_codon:yes gene_type:complete
MGTQLTGTKIKDTYPGLLKSSDNAAIGATEKVISDGSGNDSTLSLGTASASFTGALDLSGAAVTGLPADVDTTYDLASVQDGANVDITLTGSDASVDTVQLTAGTNITLTEAAGSITIDAAGGGGGGGGVPIIAKISNENYGPQWSYYNPTGGPGPYGNRLIGYSAFLPAGTYDQFNHWVRTAATTVGAVYDMAVYNVDTTSIPSPTDASFKPTTLVPNAVVEGIDATTTGQKLITVANPFTVTDGWYFFAFRFDNGVNDEFEGSYAGVNTTDKWPVYNFAGNLGIPNSYGFASVAYGTDALLVGGVGEYTQMPSDLTTETQFSGTSYRVAFGIVAQ